MATREALGNGASLPHTYSCTYDDGAAPHVKGHYLQNSMKARIRIVTQERAWFGLSHRYQNIGRIFSETCQGSTDFNAYLLSHWTIPIT